MCEDLDLLSQGGRSTGYFQIFKKDEMAKIFGVMKLNTDDITEVH